MHEFTKQAPIWGSTCQIEIKLQYKISITYAYKLIL
jgi:hypothetical protein